MLTKQLADPCLSGGTTLTNCVRLASSSAWDRCRGHCPSKPLIRRGRSRSAAPGQSLRWTGGIPTATDSATFNQAGVYTVYFSSVFQDLNDMFFSSGNVTFERLVSPATLTILNASGGRDLTIGRASTWARHYRSILRWATIPSSTTPAGSMFEPGSFLNTQDSFINAGGTLS